jgi:hypothetical protein
MGQGIWRIVELRSRHPWRGSPRVATTGGAAWRPSYSAFAGRGELQARRFLATCALARNGRIQAIRDLDRCGEKPHNKCMIRKQILKDAPVRKGPWLDLESLATFEISSEDPEHPIEYALREDQKSWRAAEDGEQTIRITFDSPQIISRIALWFEENNVARTQEFALLWRYSNGPNWREIVRQQFNFSPPNTTNQREEFNVSVKDVISIELRIVPAINGKGRASLRELFIGSP